MTRIFKPLKTIWNGPFHIGRIQQPVTLGAAILKILEVLWRLLIVGAVAMALIFMVAVILQVRSPSYVRLSNEIEATVFHDTSICSDEFPLLISFKNNSKQTVGEISFTTIVRATGHSTDLAKFHSYREDAIIRPAGTHSGCWRVPETESLTRRPLEFSVRISYANSYAQE